MGADEAVLVSDKIFAGSDTVATTYILQKAVEKLDHVQMIVCGAKPLTEKPDRYPRGFASGLDLILL